MRGRASLGMERLEERRLMETEGKLMYNLLKFNTQTDSVECQKGNLIRGTFFLSLHDYMSNAKRSSAMYSERANERTSGPHMHGSEIETYQEPSTEGSWPA